ncbi:MAG: hypothetical protein DHS20C11_25450 [Lysobacteraceae bacterium]|nr:MAG: hypothetical protein DHS20C11_25450 [Xanthomonadaceae bacterium]
MNWTVGQDSVYPKLVDTAKGKSGADPFVIAMARSHNPRLTVITEEKGGSAQKPKIPYVCQQENIRCVSLLGLIVEQKWVIGGVMTMPEQNL